MSPLAITIEDLETHASSRYAFVGSPVRIGRSELNDLPLSQPFVSGWHAVVQFDDQEIRFVDLGSTNGSILDGSPLEKGVPTLVGPESEVDIGTLRLRFSRLVTGMQLAAPAPPMTEFALKVSKRATAGERPGEAARAEVPPPSVTQAAPQQLESVEQALATSAMDLDLLYASYRGAWEHLRGKVDQLVAGMDSPERALALSRLAEKYGAVSQEPQFLTLSGKEASSAPLAPVTPRSATGGEAMGMLDAFAESYLPVPEAVSTEAGARQLLERTAEVLEAFGKSYLELRKGYEEFGKEMGVRTIRAESPVERARDVKQLLTYLLDLRAKSRTPELQSAFADLMVHQVALLNGVVEGARGILTRLCPEAVTEEAGQGKWPLKAGVWWKEYQARWHEIADEEDAISDALFGAEFTRAYTAIVGRRAGEDQSAPAVDAKRR